MAYENSNIIHVAYQIEVTANYGTNLSGSSAYTYIPVLEGAKLDATKTMHPNKTAKQSLHSFDPPIVGLPQVKSSFQTFLCGTGSAALSGAMAPGRNLAWMDLLQCVMGGRFAGSGSYVSSSATTNNFTLSASAGNQITTGSLIAVMNPQGRLETVRVGQIFGGNTVSCSVPLSFVPSTGQTTGSAVYNGYTFFNTQDPTGSIQIFYEGLTDTDKRVGTGLQGNVSFNLQEGQPSIVQYDLEGARFFTGSATNGLMFDEPANLWGAPIVFADSEIIFVPVSSSMNFPSRVNIKGNVKLTTGYKYVNVPTAGGVNISRKRQQRVTPILKAEITNMWDDVDFNYYRDRDLKVPYMLHIQVGSQPGNTVAISAPYGFITNVERGDINGLVAQMVTFEATTNEVPAGYGIAPTNTVQFDCWNSAFVVGVF